MSLTLLRFLGCLAAAALVACAAPAPPATAPVALAKSDILREIVRHCVAPAADAGYCSTCRWPRTDATCAAPPECRSRTEVWALTPEFTAIRDTKMCGCPADFVHGLALPRATVTGVEDPARPDGIWAFAWQVATARMTGPDIALAVNPRLQRSQNQLHVHLLRLLPSARADLQAQTVAHTQDLAQVWALAAQGAAARGLADYGVVVTAAGEGRFAIAISPDSPEKRFTLWGCRAE